MLGVPQTHDKRQGLYLATGESLPDARRSDSNQANFASYRDSAKIGGGGKTTITLCANAITFGLIAKLLATLQVVSSGELFYIISGFF